MSKNIKGKVYKKSNGMCALCGELLLEEDCTCDHFVPRAVYKWCSDSYAEKLIESSSNKIAVHYSCNQVKNSVLPTQKSLNQLYVSTEAKQELQAVYDKSREYINSFKTLKQDVLCKQENRCYLCGKYIVDANSTIRRIDKRKKKDFRNAMCVCSNCNHWCAKVSMKEIMRVLERDNTA